MQDFFNPCFNHYSVIQKKYALSNYVFDKFTEAADISHERTKSKQAKGMIRDELRKSLYDYDDITNVINAFRDWRQSYRDHPKIAVCESYEGFEFDFMLMNRFDNPARNIGDLSNALSNYKGKGVFLTLTYDHSKSLKQTWQDVSKDWNRFFTRLIIEINTNPYKTRFKKRVKKSELKPRLDYYKQGLRYMPNPPVKRSDMHYIRVLEAQGNGYPHIHVLFLGIDYLFYSGNRMEWLNDNSHSKNLKHFWGRGSIFVNSTKKGQTVKNPVNYLMKYIRKTFSQYNSDNKAELTQAMLWAFNKRSWDTSRGIKKYLGIPEVPPSESFLKGIASYSRLNGQTSYVLWLLELNKVKIDYTTINYKKYYTDPLMIYYMHEKKRG